MSAVSLPGILGSCAGDARSGDARSEPGATVAATAITPVPTGRDAPVEIDDVAYARTSPSQTLDLYLPAGRGKVPVVVLVHGGGFQFGNSEAERGHAQALVERGIAAAAVNYRLSGEALFPAGAQDVKASIRWLRANASILGIDPDRIGIWGSSAGGWLANMAGATGDETTIFDDDRLGNAGVPSNVQAVASWFGLSDFATLVEQESAGPDCTVEVPPRFAAPDSYTSMWLGEPTMTSPLLPLTDVGSYLAGGHSPPPWLVAHGNIDCIVPDAQSDYLTRSLVDAGAQVTRIIVVGVGHGGKVFEDEVLETTLAFLESSLT